MNPENDFFYDIHDDKEIWIERYVGDDSVAVVPSTIEDLPVTTICEHAFAFSDVTEIHVSEGIETIETEAFAACEGLNRVLLPSSLKNLGEGVFKDSTMLEQIVFPNDSPVFSVEDGALYHKTEQALVLLPPGLKTEKFTVPWGIKVIASAAFYKNSSLKYVQLPLTLEKIETGAFLFTDELKMIELPPNIKEIEPASFLMGSGMFAEKPSFVIYAFPNSVGYTYAEENKIPVSPLYAIVTD